MTKIFERDFTPNEAQQRVELVFSNLELAILEERTELGFLASHVVVEGPDGVISSGSGKGIYHRTGAKAESIEHYLTQTILAETFARGQTYAIADQSALLLDGIIQSLRKFTECEVPVISLKAYDDPQEEVLVPHILLNPDVSDVHEKPTDANRFMSKYSTNSGTAFGLTAEEALLHALMECIERHSQSMLFLGLVGKDIPVGFYHFLNPNATTTIPVYNRFADLPDFTVFGCKANGGVYFFCATEAKPVNRLAEFGAGCSFNASYALERAVTEYAQCIGIVGGAELDEDKRAHDLFDRLPGLKTLEALTVGSDVVASGNFINDAVLSDVLKEWTVARNCSLPKSMLSDCVKSLRSENYSVLQRIDKFGETGYIARVYVPGFDRFHLIRSGLQVAPNSTLL